MGSFLPPVVCRVALVLFTLFVFCLHIVVSNTYCVLFSLSCVPYVDSFSGLSIFDCPFRILSRLLCGLSIVRECYHHIIYIHILWRTQISFIMKEYKINRVGCILLKWFIRYFNYWYLQFLNNVFVIKTKVLLP